MSFLYNIAIYTVGFSLKIIALFNKKISLFVNGRKDTFEKLASKLSKNDAVVWFHCASLGEFEQGRPIIENFKAQYPNYKILVTFFSPSGYEVRKDYVFADVVTYLPLDTKVNAQKFVRAVNPQLAVFVKYEFWPNFLKELKSKQVKTILVSGIFRKDQAFFKWYGGWMRRSLLTFDHFFVQNDISNNLLKNSYFENTTLSGDTRFDRVFEITKQDNRIDFIDTFIDNKLTLIAGSTWRKDEELLIEYINNHASDNEKFIIAPHIINQNDIINLKNNIAKQTLIFSDSVTKNIRNAQVLIIDSIGLLTNIYSYANIAYVGGGFGAGLHNILEPSTFGVPILIGPNYQKFNEAKELIQLGACKAIHNSTELNTELHSLFNNDFDRKYKGDIAKNYIVNNTGATRQIMSYITKTLETNA